MKALLIDVSAREVREVEYDGLADLQKMVGGYIEIARAWDHGDVLFVDEEGMLKGKTAFFAVDGIAQPLAGNGVVVGRETGDVTADPTVTREALTKMISFGTREQVNAWAGANGGIPHASFTAIGPEGAEKTTVLGTWGDLIGAMPHPLPDQGQRIRCVAMSGPNPVRTGTTGTVRTITRHPLGIALIEVLWDSGPSSASLMVPPDEWVAV